MPCCAAAFAPASVFASPVNIGSTTKAPTPMHSISTTAPPISARISPVRLLRGGGGDGAPPGQRPPDLPGGGWPDLGGADCGGGGAVCFGRPPRGGGAHPRAGPHRGGPPPAGARPP